MKVLKIWDADYPWDIRVEKVVRSLTEAGHTVHLVCRNQGRRTKLECDGNLTIQRLPSLPRVFGPVHTAWNFPVPINPVWIWSIAQAIRDTRPDVILVRDILLALPAAILGKVHRIPVILDMAENYPAMLHDRLRYTPTGPLGRLIRHPAGARLVELLSIRLVDHIIVVVEEARERLVRDLEQPDRITVVSNTPRLDQWKPRDYLQIQPDQDGALLAGSCSKRRASYVESPRPAGRLIFQECAGCQTPHVAEESEDERAGLDVVLSRVQPSSWLEALAGRPIAESSELQEGGLPADRVEGLLDRLGG